MFSGNKTTKRYANRPVDKYVKSLVKNVRRARVPFVTGIWYNFPGSELQKPRVAANEKRVYKDKTVSIVVINARETYRVFISPNERIAAVVVRLIRTRVYIYR